jgi:hypothetical protein
VTGLAIFLFGGKSFFEFRNLLAEEMPLVQGKSVGKVKKPGSPILFETL